MPRISELLTLSLEGLQALYEDDTDEPDALFGPIAQAVASVLRFLSGEAEEGDIEEALLGLSSALGRQIDNETPKPAELSLDDIAAILMQLDPADTEGIAGLHSNLKTIIKGGGLDVSAVEHLSQAVHLLDGLACGSAGEGRRLH